MKQLCAKCGSDKVQMPIWVELNSRTYGVDTHGDPVQTDETLGRMIESREASAWCPSCHNLGATSSVANYTERLKRRRSNAKQDLDELQAILDGIDRQLATVDIQDDEEDPQGDPILAEARAEWEKAVEGLE